MSPASEGLCRGVLVTFQQATEFMPALETILSVGTATVALNELAVNVWLDAHSS